MSSKFNHAVNAIFSGEANFHCVVITQYKIDMTPSCTATKTHLSPVVVTFRERLTPG